MAVLIPTPDYGYDWTTYWRPDGQPDLDPNFATISGPRVVLEAVARRLITPRGSMLDREYGYDLRGLLQATLTTADTARIQAEIEAECLKDERVDTADVTVQLPLATGEMVITIQLSLSQQVSPFTLVFTLTADGVNIIIQGLS